MTREALALFGQRVRSRREKLGLSQEVLAARAGVHRTYLGAVERGERNITLINILRLCAALGVDPSVLLRGIK
jgi:transcriptional regulator with XRE-family HTH domain